MVIIHIKNSRSLVWFLDYSFTVGSVAFYYFLSPVSETNQLWANIMSSSAASSTAMKIDIDNIIQQLLSVKDTPGKQVSNNSH